MDFHPSDIPQRAYTNAQDIKIFMSLKEVPPMSIRRRFGSIVQWLAQMDLKN